MIEVDARQQHRHVRLVTESAGGREHRKLLGKARLEHAGGIGFDRGKYQVEAIGSHVSGVFDDELAHLLLQRTLGKPAHLAARVAQSLGVALACRALGRSQADHVEDGVAGERHQELLSGDAGSAQNGGAKASGHAQILPKRVAW